MNELSEDILLTRLLETIKEDILPLTQQGVAAGSKVFGAAILNKQDYSLVVAGTNNEIENPLWHGEVHTIKLFHEMPASKRPVASDCIFVSSHEPCSLCLSAITWAGFDNFYYFFGYQETTSVFNIPHDLKILKEVFGVVDGQYRRQNSFWECRCIMDMLPALKGVDRKLLDSQVNDIVDAYNKLSDSYQSGNKGSGNIPLA
ncbi:MAG: nucleoside deaminase [Pseudomonadales bacterium]|nr:nucleoside deaminase [Pseudomonadales bacterium]